MKIDELQKNILSLSKIFFKKKIYTELEFSLLGYFYFCPFAPTKGNSKLLSFFDKIKSFKIYIYATLHDIIKLLRSGGYSTLSSSKLKNHKTIVVSWGKLSDFNKSGEFFDKHLNVSSKNCRNVMWYIIYLDNNLPKKISHNIVLVHEIKSITLNHFKKIFLDLLNRKKKLKFINQEISHFTTFANYVFVDFENYISKAKKIIMPYEGQPFQNAIFQRTYLRDKNIESIGYIHSFPIGLPVNLSKRAGHPQRLIINSLSQRYSLINHLGWKKKELKLLPSARLKKKINFDMANKIFLPIEFFQPKKIIQTLKELINFKKIDLSNFDIRNHPSCKNSKRHVKLMKMIKQVIHKKKNYNKPKKNFSVFIGPTGSIIEALERGLEVYHICENPVLESYSKKIWKYIKSIKIKENLFEYKKIQKNKLLIFNNSKTIYKKYIY